MMVWEIVMLKLVKYITFNGIKTLTEKCTKDK